MVRVDLRLGDCLEILPTLPAGSVDAVITDPPYGMDWDTNSTRFSGGQSPLIGRTDGDGRDDWGDVVNDDKPFDPSPWLQFPKVILWGYNHFADKLPTGTTLVWIKRADHLFGSFLSDAELAWMKGGRGVYCFRKQFPPPKRMQEGNGKVLHPNQKPVALFSWCIKRAGLEPGQTILDPFMGSGSCGVAAMHAGLNYIGCEISPKYYAIAERRIKEAQLQIPMELNV